MLRNAFKMKLKPGAVEEYKRRHDALWPELARELSAAGVSDYSIFLDEESLSLFAVQKLSEANTAAWLPQMPSAFTSVSRETPISLSATHAPAKGATMPVP